MSYLGNKYQGWQWQLNQPNTIQACAQNAFGKVLKSPIALTGCGRTDAGVHAAQYFVQADIPNPIIADEFIFKINKTLPDDIAVLEVIPVSDKANCRYDAISRTYHYFFHLQKDPFLADMSYHYHKPILNLDAMQAAMSLLVNLTDYKNWCRTPDKHNTTIVKMYNCEILNLGGDRYCFVFKANRFLKSMIRILVATLLDIGAGRITIEEFDNYLRMAAMRKYDNIAPPHGLYLSKIEYPYLSRDTQSLIVLI